MYKELTIVSKQRQTLTVEQRAQIIILNKEGFGPTAISMLTKVKIQTVSSVLRAYKIKGRIVLPSRGGDRRSKLINEHKQAIIKWVDNYPKLTLKKIVQKTEEDFGLQICDNTADRCLKKYHFSVKQLTISPENRNNDCTIKKDYNMDIYFRDL